MSEAKPVTINADMMWSSLTEVNRMSGKYQVDLAKKDYGYRELKAKDNN